MTAREQLAQAAASFRLADRAVITWPTTEYPDSLANIERKIYYQRWIEAVIHFRREG